MAVVSARGLSMSFVERTLFEDVSFDIEKRDKVGFIGRNGTGKTTLFKILTGEAQATSGSVTVARGIVVGYMRQHACTDPDRTVFAELLTVFEPLIKLENEISEVTRLIDSGEGDIDSLVQKQTILIDKFNDDGGLTYKSRVRSALTGLGFSEEDFERSVGTLSGGQASKLSLAKLLLSGADFLLLDEPTNHLDINSVRWLEGFIKDFKGSALIISHDRYFLDSVTNKTIELEHKRIQAYDGNYSVFMQKKAQVLEAQRRLYERDSREIKRIEGIVEQQKRWGREHNFITAASKQKEADRIKARLVKPESEENAIHLSFKPKRESGNDVLICRNASKSFDGVPVFSNVNLHIRKGERVFIVGANGCGKTTLFKMLCKKLDADFDELKFGARVDLGYFDQMQSDLKPDNDAVTEISDAFPEMSNTEIRTALGSFLIKGDDAFKPVKALSGGERARISLLKLVLSGANFFLLDEPTNHLDAPSREALEKTLADYDGTMLIISHDRYFINKLADRILELTPEGITEYLGNYDYYAGKKALLSEGAVGEPLSLMNKSAQEKPKVNDYKLRKEEQARERKRQNDLKKAEARIEELEQEIAELESLIATDEVAGDYKKLLELSEKLESLQETLLSEMETWESMM
ncbi:MAG: ribosomal protection-like ABC-F family protein [Ruminococcus sp.]